MPIDRPAAVGVSLYDVAMAVAVPERAAGAAGAAVLVPAPPASMAARTPETVAPVMIVRRNGRGEIGMCCLLLSTTPTEGPQLPVVSSATASGCSCLCTQDFVSLCHFRQMGSSAQRPREARDCSRGAGDPWRCTGSEEGQDAAGLGR